MTDGKYVPSPRTVYCNELEGDIAPKVWNRLAGNGSLRINIDTDVNCYGKWDPHGQADEIEDKVADAQAWVAYFVRSTINRLIDLDLLNVPDEEKK